MYRAHCAVIFAIAQLSCYTGCPVRLHVQDVTLHNNFTITQFEVKMCIYFYLWVANHALTMYSARSDTWLFNPSCYLLTLSQSLLKIVQVYWSMKNVWSFRRLSTHHFHTPSKGLSKLWTSFLFTLVRLPWNIFREIKTKCNLTYSHLLV